MRKIMAVRPDTSFGLELHAIVNQFAEFYVQGRLGDAREVAEYLYEKMDGMLSNAPFYQMDLVILNDMDVEGCAKSVKDYEIAASLDDSVGLGGGRPSPIPVQVAIRTGLLPLMSEAGQCLFGRREFYPDILATFASLSSDPSRLDRFVGTPTPSALDALMKSPALMDESQFGEAKERIRSSTSDRAARRLDRVTPEQLIADNPFSNLLWKILDSADVTDRNYFFEKLIAKYLASKAEGAVKNVAFSYAAEVFMRFMFTSDAKEVALPPAVRLPRVGMIKNSFVSEMVALSSTLEQSPISVTETSHTGQAAITKFNAYLQALERKVFGNQFDMAPLSDDQRRALLGLVGKLVIIKALLKSANVEARNRERLEAAGSVFETIDRMVDNGVKKLRAKKPL